MRRFFRQDDGFTLVEMIAVIMLLALVMGLVGFAAVNQISSGKQKTAKAQISLFEMALSSYRMDTGTYPSTEQGLEALRQKPAIPPVPDNWRGPYLSKAVPLDPWKHPYLYFNPGKNSTDGYDLYSLGADAKEGGEGENEDIANWKSQ